MKFPLALSLFPAATPAQAQTWPPIAQRNWPWTRWWRQGSTVNPTDLTSLLGQYRQAGQGGVEIAAIYGVKSAESRFLDFLSPRWVEALTPTLAEGKKLDLGVDVAQASG